MVDRGVMKRWWLVPGLALVASCAAFTADDSVDLDEVPSEHDADVLAEEDDASSSVVRPPTIGESDAGTDAEVTPLDAEAVDAEAVDAEPPPVDELTEAYGVFVSPAGSTSGAGTREAPLSTIGAGIAKAKESGKRVYVCKGTYKEALELKSGISVLGGYACTMNWRREDGAYSRVESPSSPAVRAKDITSATTFSGFDVLAPDATAANASSIGLVADNAGKLVVVASKITAGKGADGVHGVEPAARMPGPNIDGKPGTGGSSRSSVDSKPQRTPFGSGGTSACGGGSGGNGATGANATCKCGFSGTPLREQCSTSIPATCYLQTLPLGSCDPGIPGGGSSEAGAAGTDGASASSGKLSSTGYAPGNGAAGTSGKPGMGGAGGSAQPVNANVCSGTIGDGASKNFASGAGGGAGGCGGVAGTPGTGGGASIAALVWSSPGLTFDDTQLTSSRGGAGGKGTLGAAPTAGGKAGATATGAGAASNGGAGGVPGVSGSGAGGPSFGIAHHGPAPTLVNGATSEAAQGGAGVAATSKSFGSKTWTLKASSAGLSKDVYEF